VLLLFFFGTRVPPAPTDIKFAATSPPQFPSHNQQQQQPPQVRSTLARMVWTKSNIARSEMLLVQNLPLVNQRYFWRKSFLLLYKKMIFFFFHVFHMSTKLSVTCGVLKARV